MKKYRGRKYEYREKNISITCELQLIPCILGKCYKCWKRCAKVYQEDIVWDIYVLL